MSCDGDFPMKRTNSDAMNKILGVRFNVLNHGFIEVVDYMGDDSSVVQAARVSFGKGIKTPEEDVRLIEFLLSHEHTSPFEMVEIICFVKAPIFVYRQWIRHRAANIYGCNNEYECFGAVDKYHPIAEEVGFQDTINKQTRVLGKELASNEVLNLLRDEPNEGASLATFVSFYWKIDVHNLMRFIRLRSDNNAQLEIRAYADVLKSIFKVWIPSIFSAFEKYVCHRKYLTMDQIEWLVLWARGQSDASVKLRPDELKMISEIAEFFHD